MSEFARSSDEVAITSDQSNWNPLLRNRHLQVLATKLKRYEMIVRDYHGEKNNKAVIKAESQARRVLDKACGSCIMERVCPIAYDFEAWASKHPVAVPESVPVVSAFSFAAVLQQRPGARC